jgi:hypothetical protein
MEPSVIQGDKIFLPVFVTLLVGMVTAALSIVRLVNDKEGKTSDYRQNWCDSVRKSLAELVANINAIASTAVNRSESAKELNKILDAQENLAGPWPESINTVRAHVQESISDADIRLRDLRQQLYHSYALTQLHFKPADPNFAPIEQSFALAIELIRGLVSLDANGSSEEKISQRNKIHDVAASITTSGREIIKSEWEIVKLGEPAYVSTKRLSIFGGGALFAILFLLGGAAFISSQKQNDQFRTHEGSTSSDRSSNSGVAGANPSPPSISQIVNVSPQACITQPNIARSPSPKISAPTVNKCGH